MNSSRSVSLAGVTGYVGGTDGETLAAAYAVVQDATFTATGADSTKRGGRLPIFLAVKAADEEYFGVLGRAVSF